MNIRDFAPHFTIYVHTANVDVGASVKVYLAQAGYDAFFIQDLEMLMDRVRENAPHFVIFATTELKMPLPEFVEQIRSINSDVRMLAVSSLSQFDILNQYRDHGIVEVISDVEVQLESRILTSIDNHCEGLYYLYQNEQLFTDLQSARALVTEMETELQGLKSNLQNEVQKQKVTSQTPISQRVAEYLTTESKEDILTRFMLHLGDIRAVYFRFLPSVRSFVATHSSYVSLDQIQGVGAQLQVSELKDLSLNLGMGLVPPSMVEMMAGAFQMNPARAYPLFVQKQLEGVWMIPSDLSDERKHFFEEEFAIMNMSYTNLGLEKRITQLEVQDPVTELFNRDYYFKKLEDEFQRARRIQQPLSLAKLSIDSYQEIEKSLGEQARDSLMKVIAEMIVKSSRNHDITCRVSGNEIALILPHCTKKGAALRAERIRRAVESSSILENGIKVTASLGVSEYPTLSASSKSLDEAATKSLHFIASKGGNKICLYKAPENHQPDFSVGDQE